MIAVAAAIFLLASGRAAAQTSSDPPEDIRPPKGMVEIPQPKKPPVAMWLGITGGAVLLALAAWWWHLRRRRRNLRSPAEIALWALAELEVMRETIAAEAFANRAAGVVRNYIAGRFGLAAPRRTTEEFLRELAKDDDSPLASQGDSLRVFLKSCDMAKFAALPLDAGQRGELIRSARGVVTVTSEPVANTKTKGVVP